MGTEPGIDPRAIASDLEIELAHARLMRALFPESPSHVRLGRFEIREPLGAGAMGHVHAAYDPRLDRRVAIKLVRLGARSGTHATRAQLLEEARAMARVSHPNILTVFDAGERADEVFVAMEYAAGGTLRQWCERPERSDLQVLEACLAAGAGLHAAHSAGLIHRDYKPDNVLLTANGVVKVADFGLALATESVESGPVGTPAYMAPEVRFHGAHSTRSDQYAFAKSTWELLYGERPPVEPADDVALARGGPVALARRVARALARALATDPDRRYPSLQHLLAELEATRAPSRRRQLVGLGLAASVGAAVAVAAVDRTPAMAAPDPCDVGGERMAKVWNAETRASLERGADRAELPLVQAQFDSWSRDWVGAHREICEATQVRHEQSEVALDHRMQCLSDRLAGFEALVSISGAPREGGVALAGLVQRLPAPGPCTRRTTSAPTVSDLDPSTRSRVTEVRTSLERARAQWTTGDWERVRRNNGALITDAEATGFDPLIADTALFVARSGAYDGGPGEDPHDQVDLLHRAASAAAAVGLDSIVATSWAELILVVGYVRSRPEEGLRMRPFAEAAIARAGGDAQVESRLHNSVGAVLDELGRHDEAIVEFEQAVKLARAAHGDEHVSVASTLGNLGDSQRLGGRHADARASLLEAIEVKTRVFGPGHPQLAFAYENLAVVELEVENLDAARDHATRAQTLYARIPEESPGVHDILASVAEGNGEVDAAIEHLERADAIRLKYDHQRPAARVEGWVRLAALHLGRAEDAQARAALDTVDELLTQVPDTKSSRALKCRSVRLQAELRARLDPDAPVLAVECGEP